MKIIHNCRHLTSTWLISNHSQFFNKLSPCVYTTYKSGNFRLNEAIFVIMHFCQFFQTILPDTDFTFHKIIPDIILCTTKTMNQSPP